MNRIKKIRKRTNFLMLAVLLTLGVYCLQSCQKTSEEFESLAKMEQIQEQEKDQSFESLEWVGEMHNELLDDVTNLESFPNFNEEELFALLQEELSSSGIEVMPFETMVQNLDLTFSFEDLSQLAEYYYSNEVIGEQTYAYINNLNSIIVNHENQEQLTNSLIDFESSVISEGQLSSTEMNMVLGAIVVARHSSEYWENVANDPSNPWNYQNEGINNTAQRGFWKKVLRILADVAGLIVGTELGGPAGGVMLGTAASAEVEVEP